MLNVFNNVPALSFSKHISEELSKAIRAVQGQKIRGPLASMIFIKHHLAGAHQVEVDRVDESEEGARAWLSWYILKASCLFELNICPKESTPEASLVMTRLKRDTASQRTLYGY